jgi:two-component system sensor histidine kinase KdpD
MKYKQAAKRLLRTLATLSVVVLVTGLLYHWHDKASTAGLINLVLVMLIAFRWGFIQAAIASVLAVGCLDYFDRRALCRSH